MTANQKQLITLKGIRVLYNTDPAYKAELKKDARQVADMLDAHTELELEARYLPTTVLKQMIDLSEFEATANRPKIIETTKNICNKLNKDIYPIFFATMCMELGGALAITANDDMDTLREAIAQSKKAVDMLPADDFPDEIVKCCYNIIMASSNERLFDWDNGNELWADVIKYASKARDIILDGLVQPTPAILINVIEKLALAYKNYTEGDIEDNLDTSIKYWNDLLAASDYLDGDEKKEMEKMIYYNLMLIYQSRKRGVKSENLKLMNKYYNEIK